MSKPRNKKTNAGDTPEQALDAYRERLAAIVPADRMGSVLAEQAQPSRVGFRVNTLKAEVSGVLASLHSGKPLGALWSPYAFSMSYGQRQMLVDHPLVIDGSVYIQSLSSQFAVAALDPQPGEQVLDLCAAPGGKTLAIAQRVLETSGGFVSAVESAKPRFYRMKQNLQRGNAGWVRTYNTDGRSVGRKTPGRFDRVLVDAPCSAETAINPDDPETIGDWSLKKIQRCAKRQVQLLLSAIQATRPGGLIVYSTCTLAPEENEGVVSEVMRRTQGMLCVENIDVVNRLPDTAWIRSVREWGGKPFNEEVALGSIRLVPTGGYDMFYLVKLRKQL